MRYLLGLMRWVTSLFFWTFSQWLPAGFSHLMGKVFPRRLKVVSTVSKSTDAKQDIEPVTSSTCTDEHTPILVSGEPDVMSPPKGRKVRERGQYQLSIAVLDDNHAILDLLETLLSMDGHMVARYDIGVSLLRKLLPPSGENPEIHVPPYDLIILDLLLPGDYSGADVFLSLRKHFSAEQLPIIVITAVDEPTLAQFRQILPDDVPLLRKPFQPRVLRQLITDFFE